MDSTKPSGNRKFSGEERLGAAREDAQREFERPVGPADPVDPALTLPPDIEDEVGLEEVDLNQAAIDTIATDDIDDNLDTNDDGVIDENDDPELISNLPQKLTESHGTGLQGKPSDRAGRYSRQSETQFYDDPDKSLTAGDIDANYEQASVVGDEAVGGTAPTPDQDLVDEIGAAVGLETDDRSFLRTNDRLGERDDRRWELDPKSSEDYQNRREP